MDYTAVELQLRQVEEAFSRSRINVYSDPRKEKHYYELNAIFQEINNRDLKKLSIQDVENYYFLLEFILNGLEYLDSSTLNAIPYEIVSCLEYVLKEWIVDGDFIIVTSLSNKQLEYHLHTYYNAETFTQLNQFIGSEFGLSLTNRLIRITLPKSLSRDYLASVVLYHELGHFIDIELSVSKKILFKKQATVKLDDPVKEESHLMEYFADLFAAQYIGDSSNQFIQRITPSYRDIDTQSHPSTSKRIEITSKFLNNESFDILEEFNKVLSKSGGRIIEKRYNEINTTTSDFTRLIPQNIENEEQLHAIFKLAWEVWLDSETNFLKGFTKRQQYQIVNNLVEKSISNYTILSKWNNV